MTFRTYPESADPMPTPGEARSRDIRRQRAAQTAHQLTTATGTVTLTGHAHGQYAASDTVVRVDTATADGERVTVVGWDASTGERIRATSLGERWSINPA